MMDGTWIALAGAAAVALGSPVAGAAEGATEADAAGNRDGTILVTGTRTETFAGTKTDVPLIEIPQPMAVITADQYLAQGAISISDTVKYAAGVTANPYGRDSRVDGFIVRGVDALQFRDGMRDIFSYYASITSDPYNFSRVEIVRGPASVLFGQGSIGGLVNLVSKTPTFDTGGEIAVTSGSYDRKEVMADANVAIADHLAVRLVGRARKADTYVDHVPDDRVFVAPSIRWQPTPDTDVTLLGLYQEDDGGSTAQFLPVVGTFLPNGNRPAIDRYAFVGRPGWDRYNGRLLQGGGSITHRFSDAVQISLKARYIDSDLDYFTHYANFYYPVAGFPGPDPVANTPDPRQPYLDGPGGRIISWAAESSNARLNVLSTDNTLHVSFNTGAQVEHRLLVGFDYSWNRVRKRYGGGVDIIDIYDLDNAMLPARDPVGPFSSSSQKQLGLYVQDQIRFFDRISVVLGARRDHVTTSAGDKDNATTFRAGIIGEIGAGLSPFFSYTESFSPLGGGLRPQTGRQFEAGVKWQPDAGTLVTATAFHIQESGRPIYGPGSSVSQSGRLTTKGVELEASQTLPGDVELLVNYGYNKLVSHDSPAFIYLPRHTASAWATKTFGIKDGAQLRLGGGVVHTGKRRSVGPAWTIVTPANSTVDGLAEILWRNWRFTVNATNLLDNRYYASCLDRGDCFMGAPRNVMGTIGYRF